MCDYYEQCASDYYKNIIYDDLNAKDFYCQYLDQDYQEEYQDSEKERIKHEKIHLENKKFLEQNDRKYKYTVKVIEKYFEYYSEDHSIKQEEYTIISFKKLLILLHDLLEENDPNRNLFYDCIISEDNDQESPPIDKKFLDILLNPYNLFSAFDNLYDTDLEDDRNVTLYKPLYKGKWEIYFPITIYVSRKLIKNTSKNTYYEDSLEIYQNLEKMEDKILKEKVYKNLAEYELSDFSLNPDYAYNVTFNQTTKHRIFKNFSVLFGYLQEIFTQIDTMIFDPENDYFTESNNYEVVKLNDHLKHIILNPKRLLNNLKDNEETVLCDINTLGVKIVYVSIKKILLE